MESKRIK